ncbi:MAG: response regulator transcription factor [Bacteroidales bacterium]|nr:response regulator transcription factor [Bacteroidales bacterium]
MIKNISIAIVDDHKLFRDGLKILLKRACPEIGEIYEATHGGEFLQLLKTYTPDVILMDIAMPEIDGIEATKRAIEKDPDLKIIALSMFGEEEYYSQMIESGAKGFILKDSDIQEVQNAIREVANGNNYFTPDILLGLIKNMNKKKKKPEKSELSERETEILYYICTGLSNQEIADSLHLSKRTVDKHRENLLLKTGAKNTASLVIYAVKNEIIEL